MNNLFRVSILAGAAAILSACASKEELPPPPPPAPPAPATTSQAAPPPAAVTPTVVPGSLEDLIATAGADRVFFAYDSYFLDDGARETLTRQAEWLNKYPTITLTIEGHADERGTREYNLALGARRATAVKNFLVGAGVASSRVETISYGKERPAVMGSTEASWAQNRRGVTVLENPNS